MKKGYVFLIITSTLLVFTYFITPYEANLMNASLVWMYKLNFKESILFIFGLGLGLVYVK